MKFAGSSIAALVVWIVSCQFSLARQISQGDVDRIVNEAIKTWDVPGAAVVIVRPDAVGFISGYGRRRMGEDAPITPDTLFPMASCSKAFTTTLAALLAYDGKLGFDDPVRRHYPDLKLSDPEADSHTTLRDVFCHRTGLGSHDFLWYRAPWSVEESIRRVRYLPFEKPFRTGFQYQSSLYSAAGLGIARAGGKPWEQLIRERIFEPLGMKNARCVTGPLDPPNNVANPHKADAAGQLRPIEWYVQTEPNPAGSIHLTPRDLVPWLQFQLGGGTRKILPYELLMQTQTPHVALPIDPATAALHPSTNLMSYALGWLVQDYRGFKVITHAGMIDGFRIQLTLLPQNGIGMAVCVNRHQSRCTNAITNQLLDQVLKLPPNDWNFYLKEVTRRERDAEMQLAAQRERQIARGEKPAKPWNEFTGEFENPALGTMKIRLENERLFWEWNSFRSEMMFLGGRRFVVDQEFMGPESIEVLDDGMIFMGVTFRKRSS